MNWKEQFRSYMEICDEDILNIDKAQLLKNENLPQYLYKYRQVTDFSINNLEENTVWLNSPSDYNDPYEFYENIDFKKLNSALTRMHLNELIDKMTSNFDIPQDILDEARNVDEPLEFIGRAVMKKENYEDSKIDIFFKTLSEFSEKSTKSMISDKLKFIQDTMKVSSFCEEPDQFLMWSHYADSHKGFCIEYDLNRWNATDIRRRILFPVVYQDHIYDSTPHMLKVIQGEDFNNLYPIISGSTKSRQWEYEKEWRFIFPIGDSFPRQNYHMDCQSKVILGYKISEEDKNKIINICNSKNLPVHQASLGNNYKLSIVKI